MNTSNIINLKTQQEPIDTSLYLPLLSKKNFLNFKQCVIVQVSSPSCHVLRNNKFKTVTLIVNDSKLNQFVINTLESELEHQLGPEHRTGFRSVLRSVLCGDDSSFGEVFVKLSDNTIITKEDNEIDLYELEKTLTNVTMLITVSYYSMNNSCGLTLRCDRLKYSNGNNSSTPDFID